ncbi:murein hydrolase activator EnvC family protein [Arthrobacter sp. NPDC097144]|uniref:murein hydrolase activator EnvC family protein n=1 Tax=Arthrobacter sp. NPDC097144 TaxID=3363946 RepID=UPI0037FF8496
MDIFPSPPRSPGTFSSRRPAPAALHAAVAAVLFAALLTAVLTVLPGGGAAPASGAPAPLRLAAQPASAYEPSWSWPLSPDPKVLRSFKAPPQRWLTGHRGVDLAAQPGVPVLSPDQGTVVFAGWVVNRPVITVDLGDGLLSSFEPVDAAKATGDRVAEGETIGVVAAPPAASHCADSCLHWGVRLRGEYVNPLQFVTDRRPSILLPLRGSSGSAGNR